MAERKREDGENNEKVHPNVYLNQYVAGHVINYLHKSNYQIEKGSKIGNAALRFLQRTGIRGYKTGGLPDPDSLKGFKLVPQVADMQRKVVNGAPSVRGLAKGDSDAVRLSAYAGQCLMASSYEPFFQSLYELDRGQLQYGFGKDVYRIPVDNSNGAGVMMHPASDKIGNYLVERYKDDSKFAFIQFGSGNGDTVTTTLGKFRDANLNLPITAVSDLDVKTRTTAEKHFAKNKLMNSFIWEQIDMGDPTDIAKMKRHVEGLNVFIHVGFIFHESRQLAKRTMSAITKVFPNATLGISEFWDEDLIHPENPEWFKFIHVTQELFKRDEFLEFMGGYGYKPLHEISHQVIEAEKPTIINSTLILSR